MCGVRCGLSEYSYILHPKIIEFLNNKIKKTNKIIKKNKIPLTHNIETFESYDTKKISQNKYLLIIIIVLIYILFILLLNNN